MTIERASGPDALTFSLQLNGDPALRVSLIGSLAGGLNPSNGGPD
jgi:hypothetical protein